MPEKHVLAVYYSLTQQTREAILRVTCPLQTNGHLVELHRIQPVEEWTLPLPKTRFFHYWWKMAWLRQVLHEPILPLPLERSTYSCVILGFQPWNLQPSLPMSAFLESPQARILRDTDVVLVITARGQWKRAYLQVLEKVTRLGGRVVDTLVVLHRGSSPANIVPTVYQLFENQAPPRGHLVELFPPFGIADVGFRAASLFGQEISHRLSEGPLQPLQGWRMVGTPQLFA